MSVTSVNYTCTLESEYTQPSHLPFVIVANRFQAAAVVRKQFFGGRDRKLDVDDCLRITVPLLCDHVCVLCAHITQDVMIIKWCDDEIGGVRVCACAWMRRAVIK